MVVTGGLVTVRLVVAVNAGTTAVEVDVTVVVEGVIDRQEQADEIPEEGNAER